MKKYLMLKHPAYNLITN